MINAGEAVEMAEYIDRRTFGFPIRWVNPPMRKLNGHTFLDVNMNVYQRLVMYALATKPTQLTGREVKAIRKSHRLNLEEFATMMDVSHSTILDWEKNKADSAPLKRPAELYVRGLALQLVPGKVVRSHFKNRKAHPVKQITALAAQFKKAQFSPVDYMLLDGAQLVSEVAA